MSRILLVFGFLGLLSLQVVAQPGHYFLSHYKPGNDNISYLSFDIQQDRQGILYFANQSGVLQFDGRNWTMISVPGAVYALSLSDSDEIFVGNSSGFGRLGLNSENKLTYLSLSDSLPKAKNIFAASSLDSVAYFLTDEKLFQYNIITQKAKELASAPKEWGSFTGLYHLTTGIYASTENGGLKKITGTGIQPSDITGLNNVQLIFSERSPDQRTDLIGADDGRFFLRKKGIAVRQLKLADSVYLNANVVVNASWVTDQMVALGTLRGGVVFVNIDSNETLQISNYYTGLPDNEIYSLHTDRHHGVWVAHDYGFTRIAPFLPFRTFNHYKGLQGNLLCVASNGNEVYVGTTLGLFRLTKEEIYQEEVYDVKRTVAEKVAVEEVIQAQKKGKRGILGLLKKKSKEEPPPVVAKEPKKTTKVITQKKTRRVLKGIEYVYKQVEEISGKVDQLSIVDKRLLSSGVGGVFEINGLKATPISREPVRLVFYSKHLGELLISTYDDDILAFKPSKSGWTSADFPDSLSAHADYMFEDNLQDLWICSRDYAIKIGIEEGEILDAETIPLPSASVDKTVGLAYGQEVYLTQNGAFYHYASFKNTFVRYDSLPGPKKYFASAGYFWFYDGHKWRTVDRRLQGTIKTEWLSLFPDIRFLAPAEQGKSLWFITSSNELYRFSGDSYQINLETNPLFLKEAKSKQAQLTPKADWKVDERESSLSLEFIQPDYVGEQAVEYRYQVIGLNDVWSDWSTLNNVINFSFLPPGDYKVLVQSKDLFDKVTELDTIKFSVVPPYWKRPWFYALEFLFFGTLVVLSLRISGANSRYRYLSRFLSALTVIMLIQFIQTVASSNITMESTPVADFFIQVLIALLVLPVEEFLRKKMMNAEKVAR